LNDSVSHEENFLREENVLLSDNNMDMSVSCGSCGKKIQDYPVYCYMCDDDFCSDQCHMNRHNKQWQKF